MNASTSTLKSRLVTKGMNMAWFLFCLVCPVSSYDATGRPLLDSGIMNLEIRVFKFCINYTLLYSILATTSKQRIIEDGIQLKLSSVCFVVLHGKPRKARPSCLSTSSTKGARAFDVKESTITTFQKAPKNHLHILLYQQNQKWLITILLFLM